MDSLFLALNSGSSSLKFALARVDGDRVEPVLNGACEGIGGASGRFWQKGLAPQDEAASFPDHAAALDRTFTSIDRAGVSLSSLLGAGHRLVHGGEQHQQPERLTPAVLAELKALVPFAPLHLPSELLACELVTKRLPSLPQVLCFDTAFHAALPDVAKRLALPRSLHDAGLRRYGFHGISCEAIVRELEPSPEQRTVIAHIGSGVSLTAISGGESVDTTMGFSPTGGVVMGTRSGDLDPGVLLHLLAQGWDHGRLEKLVNREAGLKGLSGSSADLRALLEARAADPAAALAVAVFVQSLRKAIGALAAALGGLDALVFTAGVGEHSAVIRAEVCEPLGFLGVALDAAANARHDRVISAKPSRVRTLVIPTDEDGMILRHTFAVLTRESP